MNFSNKTNSKDEQELTIDMTPLIDVIFLLLIFFMITTTFDQKQKISVNLPGAQKTKEVETKKIAKEITVTADSKIFIDSKQYSTAALENYLKEEIKKTPETSVVIRADGDVRHAKIVEILDLSKREKVKNISIAVKPK